MRSESIKWEGHIAATTYYHLHHFVETLTNLNLTGNSISDKGDKCLAQTRTSIKWVVRAWWSDNLTLCCRSGSRDGNVMGWLLFRCSLRQGQCSWDRSRFISNKVHMFTQLFVYARCDENTPRTPIQRRKNTGSMLDQELAVHFELFVETETQSEPPRYYSETRW